MAEHACEAFIRDDMNFVYAKCECGWNSPPCPGLEEATDFFAEHARPAHIEGETR